MQALRPHARWLWLGLIIGTAATLFWASLPEPWPQFLAFLLLYGLPVFTWSLWPGGPLAERFLTAAGLALLLNVLLVLALSYLPGQMVRPLQLALHTLLAMLPLFRYPNREAQQETPSKPRASSVALIILILLIAVALRVVNLGYSEFQGDEGTIMVRAAAIITGDDAEIFLHQKGPVEILLPLGLWGVAGTINEFWARLPFAWASVFAVGTVMALAWRWFGRTAGLAAGAFFALVGFGVAFGRIVQYQSLVMLWGTLALLHAIRYEREGRRGDLWLTAIFLAGGLLAHYDAVLVVPAISWLLLRHMWREKRMDWKAWGGATAVGGLTLAVFYVPFALNPNFAQTSRYLVQGRIGAGNGNGWLSWSGPDVWRMITFYNSLYFIVGLVGFSLIGVWMLWLRREGMTAALFFFTPLLFYLFIVADPRTHVYTFFPGVVILAAYGAAHLWRKWAAGRFYYLVLAGFAVFWLVSANYIYLMFVNSPPERQRNWVEARPSFYPATWSEPPLYGLFGFPHQAGWRAVHALLPDDGYPYASNEEKEVTTWYMMQSPRTHCANFNIFILATNAQDEVPYNPAWLDDMFLNYEVTVNGRFSLQIFGRQPVDHAPTNEASGVTRWLIPEQVAPAQKSGAYPVNITLGANQVRLLGYDLDTTSAYPGGQIILTLYWQPLVPFDQNYQVFAHLFDGELRAQDDSAPECAMNPTTRWEPGQIIADPHIISIPPETQPGSMELLAGMYNLLTQDRLQVPDAVDNAVHLTYLIIQSNHIEATK